MIHTSDRHNNGINCSSFAKRYIVLFIVVLLLPSIIFYKDVVFDKVLFVNQWLLCIGQGGIIAIIVNMAMIKYERERIKNEDVSLIKNYISILKNIIQALNESTFDKEMAINNFHYIETSCININEMAVKLKVHGIMLRKNFVECRDIFEEACSKPDTRLILPKIQNIIEEFEHIINSYKI